LNIRPFEVVEILVRFEGYRGRHVMHCHNLGHEDMAMMTNVDVT
jgi:FtsP/CotA-like multicopper oxidase with cupredoxin domain